MSCREVHLDFHLVATTPHSSLRCLPIIFFYVGLSWLKLACRPKVSSCNPPFLQHMPSLPAIVRVLWQSTPPLHTPMPRVPCCCAVGAMLHMWTDLDQFFFPPSSCKCGDCCGRSAQNTGASRQVTSGFCQSCGGIFPWSEFPRHEQHTATALCRACKAQAATPTPLSLSCGDCMTPCTFAQRFCSHVRAATFDANLERTWCSLPSTSPNRAKTCLLSTAHTGCWELQVSMLTPALASN